MSPTPLLPRAFQASRGRCATYLRIPKAKSKPACHTKRIQSTVKLLCRFPRQTRRQVKPAAGHASIEPWRSGVLSAE